VYNKIFINGGDLTVHPEVYLENNAVLVYQGDDLVGETAASNNIAILLQGLLKN
jgi:hypothetical protein